MGAPGKPKTGGRRKGSLNARTQAKVDQSRRLFEAARVRTAEMHEQPRNIPAAPVPVPRNQASGLDVLREFMNFYRGLAAHYQPWPAQMGPNPNQDEKKFLAYSQLAYDAAKNIAPFESPKFSAVMIGQQTVTEIKITGGLPEADLITHEGQDDRHDVDHVPDAAPGPQAGRGGASDVPPGAGSGVQAEPADEPPGAPVREAVG